MGYGFQGFKPDFSTIFSDFLAIAIYLNFIPKSLKQPNFVHTHGGQFVQCVSPIHNSCMRIYHKEPFKVNTLPPSPL